MNVLITGITGMVGSHLVDYLIENTHWDIYGFIRWNDRLDNLEHHFDRINKKDRIFLINGDLNDLPSVISASRRIRSKLYISFSCSILSKNIF